MKTHDDIQADLPLYALGSLDAEERQEIDRHLAAGCDACSRELTAWGEVVGLLPLERGDVPPEELKARLLERVRGGRPSAGAVIARRRIGWAIPLALAAAALLAFATSREVGWRAERARQATVIASLQQELTAARGDTATVSATLAARENDVAALRAALADAQQSLAILQARGLTLVSLKETKDAPPAEAHALLSAPSGRALFYAFDLPPVASDQTYELWWITEKQGPVPAGTFRPDERGLGRVAAPVPADAGAIQAAAVTVERAGGVPKPQGPMVLLGAAATKS
jgi:anti-sigma-K factor RskA